MYRSKIIGLGHYVPERIVTNQELTKYMDTSDEWIKSHTGIEERRWHTPGKDTTSNMALKASKTAIANAGLKPKDIDFIIFATISSDYFFPGAGVLLQRDLGVDTIGALDIKNQCSGFIYGLSVADQFIKTGMYKTILVVGAEILSIALDITTRGRKTAVIFGDGAGAAVLQRTTTESGILSTHLHTQGKFAEKVWLREPGIGRDKRIYEGILSDYEGIHPQLDGKAVCKNAIIRLKEVIHEALIANKRRIEDIDHIVLQQSNLKLINYITKKLGIPEKKVFTNIQKYANTSAASVAICLSEMSEQKILLSNQLVCLASFGSGFSWASALIKW